MGFWDVFHNTTAIVQIAMLLTVLGAIAVPAFVLTRWLQLRMQTRLPPDTVFAISRDGDLLHLIINKQAPLARDHLSTLLLELAVEKTPLLMCSRGARLKGVGGTPRHGVR